VIRVVAGEFRGRRLAVGPGVRPTTERAREALFSIVGSGVRGARVLDAAAGSGALGFEALSRGAREVHFVEADRRVARVLDSNASVLGVNHRVRVAVRSVAAYLKLDRPAGFDLVFFDPPWADPVTGEMEGLWSALADEGTFVVERGSGGDPWPGAPVAPEVRKYGTTVLFLYRRSRAETGSAGEPEGSDRRGD
jgi:16S rRNA (guanine966-N2)-methyltransferase